MNCGKPGTMLQNQSIVLQIYFNYCEKNYENTNATPGCATVVIILNN